MSELLEIARKTEKAGLDLRKTLLGLRKRGLFRAEDMVVVKRDEDGAVGLHQMKNTSAMGALGGAVWGGLYVAGHASDLGVSDDFMRDAGTNLPKGGVAVFMLISNEGAAPLLAQLQTLGHTNDMVLRAELHSDFRKRLGAALATSGAATLDGEEVTEGASGTAKNVVGASV